MRSFLTVKSLPGISGIGCGEWEHVELVWMGSLGLLMVGLLGECGRALWRVIR